MKFSIVQSILIGAAVSIIGTGVYIVFKDLLEMDKRENKR